MATANRWWELTPAQQQPQPQAQTPQEAWAQANPQQAAAVAAWQGYDPTQNNGKLNEAQMAAYQQTQASIRNAAQPTAMPEAQPASTTLDPYEYAKQMAAQEAERLAPTRQSVNNPLDALKSAASSVGNAVSNTWGRLAGAAQTVTDNANLSNYVNRKFYNDPTSFLNDEDKALYNYDLDSARRDLVQMRAAVQRGEETADSLAALEAQIKQANELQTAVNYMRLRGAEDFGEKSKYAKSYTDEDVTHWGLLGENKSINIDDNAKLYELVNGNSEIREADLQMLQNAAAGLGGGALSTASAGLVYTFDPTQVIKEMSADEKRAFNYIYNTRGGDAAKAYLEYLWQDLNARHRASEEAYWKKAADEDPVGASVASVAAAPYKGFGYLQQVLAAIDPNESIDPNAPYNRFSYINQTIRGETAQNIENDIAEKWGRTWGKVGSVAYQAGMSQADSMYNQLITGGITGDKMGQNFALAILGSGAAADTVLAMKDAGASDQRAMVLGAIAGAAEIVTEKMSIDALFDKTALAKGIAGYLAKNFLTEAGEEGLSNFINLTADIIYDAITNETSDLRARVEGLMADGMPKGEAFGKAIGEWAAETGVDMAAGGLGGLLLGGVGAGVNFVTSGGAKAAISNGAKSIQQSIEGSRWYNEAKLQEAKRNGFGAAMQETAPQTPIQNSAQNTQTNSVNQPTVPQKTAQTATDTTPTANATSAAITQTDEQIAAMLDPEAGEVGGLNYSVTDNGNGTWNAVVENADTGETEELRGAYAITDPLVKVVQAARVMGANVQGDSFASAVVNSQNGNAQSAAMEATRNPSITSAPLAPQNEESSVGAATAGQFTTEYDELGEKYGWQDVSTRDAAYAVRVPRSTNGTDRVSATVGNALSARVTDDYMASLIEANTVKGGYSFIPISNDTTTRRATRRIQRLGWADAMAEFHDEVRANRMTADVQAMGMILYNNAVNSGDYEAALDILADFQTSGTTIARALQIRQILRKLTPEGKLYGIQKAVAKLNEQLTKNGRNMIGEPFVFEYSDAVGKKIADGVAKKLKTRSARAQTFLEHIAAEISKIANEQIPADVKDDTKRARRDFVRDYILNRDFFDDAYQKAKEEILRQYEARGEQVPPELQQLLDSSLRDAMYEQLVGRKDVTISDDALEAYAYAKTAQEEQAAMKRIAKEIAAQLPSTLEEKINALRYLNMLGNFRTQNRNILGNSAMFLTASAKYYTAAAIEKAVAHFNPNFERTKAVNVGKARLDAARAAFKTYEEFVLGEAKYNDQSSRSSNEIMRMAEKEKTAFKFGDNRFTRALGIANKQGPIGKAFQAMSNATTWMMEHGDIPFAKVSFVRSLAGYMAAHNVTAEQWNDPAWQTRNASFVDKAIQHAANEAQQDTFRDNNAFSTWVSKFGRTQNTPKAARVALEGLLPFRKTPANVAVRAVEYSPLGILTTAVDTVKAAKGAEKNGQVVTGADIVDDLAKNFVGTALVALGWLLAKQGFLRGGDDDDERVAAWNDQVGHQAYSIEIGGTSYTLDWVAPAAIPLFIGAEIFNATRDKNYSFSDLEGAFTKITEPMLKMSMLQSVDDFLNGGYGSNGLQKVAELGASYLTQVLTSTLLGQAERTFFEPNRMATYRDPTRNMPKWLQGVIGKASAKTIGVDAYQYEYVDLWGRPESNGELWERAVTNFLSPGYVSHVDMDEVETEIQRLYDYLTENSYEDASSVLPAAVKRTGLSREEYVKKAQTVGAARAGVLASMFKNPTYKAMSPENQAKAVQCVYDYANAAAADDTSKYAKWIRDALKSPNPAQVILSHVRAG